MNEKQIRQQVVDLARSWLGRVQGDAGHKEIIDLYNSYTPHPRGYKMTYTDPWCAATVSALGIKLGLTDIMPVECSCKAMIALYKEHSDSRWEERDDYIPKPGDLIFYDWDDPATPSENTGDPEHVGIVVDVTGNVITVIEGNLSKAVKERKLEVNGRYIRGFALPAYHKHATADDFVARVIASARFYGVIDAKADVTAPATIDDVLVMFKRAIDTGWLIDGAPLQEASNVIVPPVIEEPSAPAPSTLPELKLGSEGPYVKTLQGRLNNLGYNCGTVDGIFGSKTLAAVKAFQAALKLEVDGMVGPITWGALYSVKIKCDFSKGMLLELKPTDIRKIEYVHGKDPVEGIVAAHNRIGCDILVNGNFFALSTGETTGYIVDEGKQLPANGLLSPYGYAFVDKKQPVFCRNNEVNAIDFLSGYPCLLKDGKVFIDTTEAGFNSMSTTKRGRTAIGLKADGTFIVRCITDNDVANKISIPALANYMLSIGCVNAINLDGGGSVSWITPWHSFITSRNLDGFLAIWLS